MDAISGLQLYPSGGDACERFDAGFQLRDDGGRGIERVQYL